MTDKQKEYEALKELIQRYISWVFTRRFYAPAQQISILASLQKRKGLSKEPPNARNDAECHAFNLVLNHAEANDFNNFLPFFYVHFKDYRYDPVTKRPLLKKTVADRLNIAESSIYNKAHAAGVKYMAQTQVLLELHGKMCREVEEFIVD